VTLTGRKGRLFATLAVAPIVALAGVVTLGAVWPAPTPRAECWGTRVVDRGGALIALSPAPGGVWRFRVSPEQVSPFLVQLLVAVEDRRFATEPGVDPRAVLRAGWQWLRAGHVVSGGSTLTMQVAKLLDPRPRGLSAKVIEAARGVDLWWRMPRRDVLGLWLSLAPFGGNLVGVEAASYAYFGKPPGALDAAEAALLVALPRRPEALRPDRHPEAARRIRDRILRLAETRGLLTPEETRAAIAEALPTARQPMPRAVPQLFARVHRPPLLTTTLDGPTQAALQRLARATLAKLPPDVSLAVMIADLPSRRLRAIWAGDWGDARRAGAIDLTSAERSPGSALKPFLYGLAFSQGLANPDTLLADSPARFGGYAPEDFTGRFAGNVRAADALRRSLNLPAVRLLAQFGAVRFAAALSAASEPLRLPRGAVASLPVVLGGAGQTMRGMMALYAALATDGAVSPLGWRPSGVAAASRLLSPASAQTIAAILTRALPGAPEGQGIAWKTGTSWGDRDNWAFGFDRAQLVGVWVGRPDGTAMDGGAAADHALPVLARVFGLLPASPRSAAEAMHLLSFAVTPDPDPLRLLFPPPGAVIDGAGALDLKAMGGIRPLSFLVDGAPVASVGALRTTQWTPPGPGFYRVTVLDAHGRAAQAAIRIKAAE
jgi:penicillin-binding protein 1C